MTAKKRKLMEKLMRRLSELHAPSSVYMPSVIELVLQGKMMIAAVKITQPCKCDMCGGMHEKLVFLAYPAAVPDLHKLFHS